jgi:cell wall-associated NlpC family hydrolase
MRISFKIFLLLTLSLIFIAFSAVSVFAEGEPSIGKALADNINIRKEYSTKSTVVGKLVIGQEVKVLESRGDWFKVQTSKSVIGWVYSNFVAITDSSSDIKRAKVTGDRLNVRQEPSEEAKILHTLDKNEEIIVTGKEGIWYKVNIDEKKSGYIHSDYAKITDYYPVGRTTGSNINFRPDRSTDSQIIKRLSKDTKVYVIDYKDKWYNVMTTEGTKGWITSDYVKLSSPQSTSVSVSRSSSRKSATLVATAKKLLGKRYVWGATGPNTFDCSGFTSYVYKLNGYKIPRTSKAQGKYGTYVKKSELQVGDLVFFDTSGAYNKVISHCGIYIGGGQFIHASSSKTKMRVTISPINSGFYAKKYVTARRVLK